MIDLRQAHLVQVAGQRLARAVEVLEREPVLVPFRVATGDPVVQASPEIPGEVQSWCVQSGGVRLQGVGVPLRLVADIAVFDRLGKIVPAGGAGGPRLPGLTILVERAVVHGESDALAIPSGEGIFLRRPRAGRRVPRPTGGARR